MYYDSPLDCDLILEQAPRVYMGEIPRDFDEIPAPVVVNLCGVFPPGYAGEHVVLALPMLDTLDTSAQVDQERLERFLASVHVHASEQASYWHCHAGLNRSGFALAAYLHLYRDLRISETITLLRERRSGMVLCNNVFERALREWYGDEDEQDFQIFSLEIYLQERRRRRERGLV